MARPKVEVREFRTNGPLVAWCGEPGCTWLYVNSVKTDVQHEAQMHRARHRRESEGR